MREKEHFSAKRDSAKPEARFPGWEATIHSLARHCPKGALFVIDCEYRYLIANGVAFRDVGLSTEQLVGRTVAQVFPEHWKVIKPHCDAALNGQPSYYEIEYEGRLTANHTIPVEDDSGPGGQAIVLTRDITEERHRENAILESERQKRVILDASRELVAYYDTGLRIIWANRVAGEYSGYSPEEMVGRLCYEIWQHRDAPCDRCPVLHARESRQPSQAEMTTPNGRLWNLRAFPVIDEGRVIGIVEFGEDITQKRAEEQMRQTSEAKYRLLAENTSDVIFMMNENLKLQYFSPSVETLTGYTPEEAMALPLEKMITAESLQPIQRQIRRRMTQETEGRGDDIRRTWLAVYIHKDGHLIWTETVTTPVRGESGEFKGLTGVMRDITERMKAEAALRESEERSRSITAALPDMLFEFDRNGVFVSAHAPDKAAFLVPPEDFLGKSVDQILSPELAKLSHDYIGKTLTSRQMQVYRYNLKMDGFLRHYETRMVPKGESNTLAIVRDITDQHEAEAALRESEERSRSITAALPDMLFEFDRNGVFVSAHAPDPDALLAPAESFLGKAVDEVLSPELVELTHQYIAKTLSARRIQTYSYTLEIEGRTRHFETRMVPKGESHTLAIVRDITRESELQEQLTQAQKMESIGRLAGGVAHDFNNLLGAILVRTELAMEQISADHAVHNQLQEIQKAAHQSADLTRQLLAFARQQTIEPKILNLNDAVSQMLKMLGRLIGEDVVMTFRSHANLWDVEMDPSQVQQILSNLCINARDAISGHGEIIITTTNLPWEEAQKHDARGLEPGDYVQLSVEDDGCGMTPETVKRIFEPFFTTKGHDQGTGLGLATVHGIVAQNRGRIHVQSTEGTGSQFRVWLPRCQNSPAHTEETPQARPEAHGETILLVEDDPIMLEPMKAILEALGYQVLATQSPLEAINLARHHAREIHALMTDVVMPGMNGRELSEALRKDRPGLPTLFMSGYTGDVISQRGRLQEGVHFISKPFNSHKLAVKLRDVLGEKE